MTDLDKKLEEIMIYFVGIGAGLDDYGANTAEEQRSELVAAVPKITQAFIDAGWKKCTEVYGMHAHVLEDDGDSHSIKPDIRLTREEWEQQAAKEGYAQVKKTDYRDIDGAPFTQITISYPDGSGEYARVPQFAYMTGQEWYERFKREMVEGYDLRSPAFTSVQAIEAAKKAAGIE